MVMYAIVGGWRRLQRVPGVRGPRVKSSALSSVSVPAASRLQESAADPGTRGAPSQPPGRPRIRRRRPPGRRRRRHRRRRLEIERPRCTPTARPARGRCSRDSDARHGLLAARTQPVPGDVGRGIADVAQLDERVLAHRELVDDDRLVRPVADEQHGSSDVDVDEAVRVVATTRRSYARARGLGYRDRAVPEALGVGRAAGLDDPPVVAAGGRLLEAVVVMPMPPKNVCTDVPGRRFSVRSSEGSATVPPAGRTATSAVTTWSVVTPASNRPAAAVVTGAVAVGATICSTGSGARSRPAPG